MDGEGEEDYIGNKEVLRVMVMFIILIVEEHTYAKLIKLHTINMYSYVNYTSTHLF